MLDYFVKKRNVSRADAAEICAFIADMAKDRSMVNRMVNKWMFELINKHKEFYVKYNRLPKLIALHGQDYRNRLDSKCDTLVELFDELLPVIELNGFIPFKWLKDMAETKVSHISDRALSDKFDEYMKRKGYSEIKRANVHTKVLWRGNDTKLTLSGSIRRISEGQNQFDFANLCSSKYEQGTPITQNNIEINTTTTWKTLSRHEEMREQLQVSNALEFDKRVKK
jgi:hypothetical protein